MPTEGLPLSAPAPSGLAGKSIADVVQRMDELLRRFDRAGDYRAVFLRSYRTITLAVREAVGETPFADAQWLAALDVQFAQEYFDALDDFEAGRPIARCWQLAFDLATRRRTTVLADLVLGMNAHIVHDLPVALWKLGLGDGTRALRQRDFTSVDDLLARRIDDVQRQVCRHYSLGLWLLDRVTGSADEIVTEASLRVARARAWTDGLALIDAIDLPSRDALRAALDVRACAAGLPWRIEAEAAPGWLSRWIRRADRRLALARWKR
jgi:hypothetical protein